MCVFFAVVMQFFIIYSNSCIDRLVYFPLYFTVNVASDTHSIKGYCVTVY